MDDRLIMIIMIAMAGLANGIGALPVLFTDNVSQKTLDIMLGFAAGIMLAAGVYSLILPAFAESGGDFRAAVIVSLGVLAGGLILDIFDKIMPEAQLDCSNKEINHQRARGTWLFVMAVALHNFPEGLATGVGFGSGDIVNGITIALGIAIHNLPEGLSIAISLRCVGYRKYFAVFVALMAGLIEPIGAGLGLFLVHIFQPIVGFILALAGGAMLFTIIDEIIPTTHTNGYHRQSTYSSLIGFVSMVLLSVAIA